MTELLLHLDEADGEPVWWAEAPGFTAAAGTLTDLRQLATGALGPFSERLDAPEADGVRQVHLLLT